MADDDISKERFNQIKEDRHKILPLLENPFWLLEQLDYIVRKLNVVQWKACLETVLPYVDDAYARESLDKLKANPIQYLSRHTSGKALFPHLYTKIFSFNGLPFQIASDMIKDLMQHSFALDLKVTKVEKEAEAKLNSIKEALSGKI